MRTPFPSFPICLRGAVGLVALLVAAVVMARPACAQAPRGEAADGVPTVTIINKVPAVSEGRGAPQLEISPSSPGQTAAAAPPSATASGAPQSFPAPAPRAGTASSSTSGGADGVAQPATAAAAPAPPPLPPTLSIDIDLARQLMTVAENGVSLHTWQISSARYGYRTPTGTFQPTWMAQMWYSRQYDLAPMPHAIFFHKGVAIHGTYATRALGNPASHGCVRLALANAAALFKLVSRHGKERTEIVVHGTPDHSTAGRVASYGRRGSEDVVKFRRASSYRYLPPSAYGRGYATTRRVYAAPRYAPRGLYNGYSYGYGF